MEQLNENSFLKTGTTGLALRFKDGVIIAADKRVSGGYVIKKDFDKVHMVSDNIGMAVSGLVSDAMALVDVMRSELKLYEYDNGAKPKVKTAANLLGLICHSGYRSFQFYWVQLIVGGYDETGGRLYSIDPSGAVSEDDYLVIGSGSLFALSMLEDGWKEDLTKEAAIELAKRALRSSISRDLYTGDGMDFWIITKEGVDHQLIKIKETETKE